MLENQGIFNLAAQSQANTSLSRSSVLLHTQTKASIQTVTQHAGGGAWNNITNTQISPAAKLKAFLKDVLDKTDDNLISDDMMKRLDKASHADNKEISAEKLRQAKQKLQSLRMQAQMAAATGDPKTLRRIAAEAAAAAHEVANAVRGLASGIAATALTADGSSSGNVNASGGNAEQQAAPEGESAEAAASQSNGAGAQAGDTDATDKQTAADPQAAKDGQPKDQDDAYTKAPPAGTDGKSWGREALRKLSDEAHTAIAQARGLIAFCAQAARAARKHRPDADEDKAYRDLQGSVSDAEHDVDAAITAAGKEIADGSAPSGDTGTDTSAGGTADSGVGLAIDSTTVVVQTTTVIAVGTDISV